MSIPDFSSLQMPLLSDTWNWKSQPETGIDSRKLTTNLQSILPISIFADKDDQDATVDKLVRVCCASCTHLALTKQSPSVIFFHACMFETIGVHTILTNKENEYLKLFLCVRTRSADRERITPLQRWYDGWLSQPLQKLSQEWKFWLSFIWLARIV